MEQQADKQIIRKYLKGDCTPAELQLMSQYLQREDAGELIDQVWAEEWEEFQEEEISDQEIAKWKDRFTQERLHENLPAVSRKPVKFISLRYAAIWLVLIAGLGTWYGVNQIPTQTSNAVAVTMLERINSNGQRVQIKLSDGSTVYLAGGSKLRYPSRFFGTTRDISLQGEAFFEIAKNPKKPFIIHTGIIKTQVVGTSFRINAFKNQPYSIDVATGKVRVSHQHGKQSTQLALLTPGQSMSWKNNQATFTQVNAEDVSEWKNGRLVFDGASLGEMAAVLERWYGVDIRFKHEKRKEQHLSITLSATIPLNDIMEVIAGTAKFRYDIQERQVIIN